MDNHSLEQIPPRLVPFFRDYACLLQKMFGADLQGLYLHGSISLNAFDPESSDIDVLVVLSSVPQRRLVRRLHQILCRESVWGKRLDGLYLHYPGRQEGMGEGAYDFPGGNLCVRNGRVRKDDRLPAAARAILLRNGITVAGRNPQELFAEVSAEELRREMFYNLEVYWRRRIERPWRFLFAEPIRFAVSTLPRILVTLETGKIISKQEGVRFLREHFPEWTPLLNQLRSGRTTIRPIRRMRTTVRFIRAMIEEGLQKNRSDGNG